MFPLIDTLYIRNSPRNSLDITIASPNSDLLIEINLGEFDPINTEQFTTTERDKSVFNPGTIIFNTTTNSLQVFDGVGFADISEPFAILTVTGTKVRFSPSMTAGLGAISITIS